MTNDKLNEIIKRKNEDLEESTVRYARNIIDAIGNNQVKVKALNKETEELRAELKSLEIEQLDATSILGN